MRFTPHFLTGIYNTFVMPPTPLPAKGLDDDAYGRAFFKSLDVAPNWVDRFFNTYLVEKNDLKKMTLETSLHLENYKGKVFLNRFMLGASAFSAAIGIATSGPMMAVPTLTFLFCAAMHPGARYNLNMAKNAAETDFERMLKYASYGSNEFIFRRGMRDITPTPHTRRLAAPLTLTGSSI